MKLFFSVGEPSGDIHGANLIRALKERADVTCVGYGGPRMAEAGCELHEDLTQLAVMWLGRVITNLHRFGDLLYRADRYLQRERPAGIVLIDYPGFNWWIAWRAKVHRIPVFYYGTPQMWAWAPWRIRKMRRLVDYALCKLPFEARWYQQRGCRAEYVGHPFFDETERHHLDQAFMQRHAPRSPYRLVTILPGSRTQEIERNLPMLVRAAEEIHRQVPQTRFAVSCLDDDHARLARRHLAPCAIPIDVHGGRTPELIHLAECCLACSGSVSLELLYHTKPTVVLYHVHRWGYWLQGIFRRVKYITLVNLLASDEIGGRWRQTFDPDAAGAERVPFPEYLTCADRAPQIAAWAVRWLTDGVEYRRQVDQLRQLKERFAIPGASGRAADCILKCLRTMEESTASYRLPQLGQLPGSSDLRKVACG